VKEQLELHNLCTDHVTIRSQLKYIIEAKVVGTAMLELWAASNSAKKPCVYYCHIVSQWVEVKATLPTGKLELFKQEQHPPTRSWESMNPLAGS